MKRSLLLAVFALAVLMASPAKAITPAYYDFAFSIPVDGGGTITGEIIGLQDNATSVPYDIVITSDPYNNSTIDPSYVAGDYSLKDNGYLQSPYVDGRFVVTTIDGTVSISGTGQGNPPSTGAGLSWYKVLTTSPYKQIEYNFNTFGSSNGEGTEGTDIPTTFYGNENGFGLTGATFSPGTLSTVPEPGQWGMGVSLAFACGLMWRRFSRPAIRAF